MRKSFLNVLMIAGFVGTGFAARAQDAQGGQFSSGVFFVNGGASELQDVQQSMMSDTGYHINPSDMSASFLMPKHDDVKRAFAGANHLKTNLPKGLLPKTFIPIIADIADTINKVAKKGNERDNGISNNALATKIVRLSFCFGTDPYVVMAQIQQESTFDRKNRSSTGAVGLTQMTSVAIDEVNDQFGNHGEAGANLDNLPFIQQAISCYTGGAHFSSMIAAGAIPKGAKADRHPAISNRAKAWIKADIDRQLIYGQIVLKVNLARARAGGQSGNQAISSGLRDYNGDKKHGARNKYQRKILRTASRV